MPPSAWTASAWSTCCPTTHATATVLTLLAEGYADRMVLSHDAAFFSRVTPPSWRAAHAPHWNMENLPRRILPALLDGGASREQVHQLMVVNPARRPASPSRPVE